MKNKNTIAYYEKLRELFPKIEFKEGRFLRDFKFCLKDFEKQNPNCTYEEVVKEFATPEENVHNYIMGEDFEYFFQLIQKKSRKALVIFLVLVAFLMGGVLVFRWSVYDKLEMQRAEIPNLSNKIAKVIEHIDLCMANIESMQGMNSEEKDYWRYSPENTLRSTLEYSSQVQEVLHKMRDFSDKYVEVNEKYFWGDDLTGYDLSLRHKVVVELDEGLRVFQNYLNNCIMQEVYLHEPEKIKKHLLETREQFGVMQNSLEVHNFIKAETVEQWIAYYWYFLGDIQDWSVDFCDSY